MGNLTDLKNLLYLDVKNYHEMEMEAEKSRDKEYAIQKVGKKIIDFDNFSNNYQTIMKELKEIYSLSEIKSLDLQKKVRDFLIDRNNKENKDNLIKSINKLVVDFNLEHDNYMKLCKELATNKQDMIESRKIISYLKYGQILKEEQVEFIKNRLEKEGIKKSDIVVILEKVKIHNTKCRDTGKKVNKNQMYEIVNIIKQGYEKIELPRGNFDRLDEKARRLYNALSDIGKNDWDSQLQFLNYFDNVEKEYILKKLLIQYQNDMYDSIAFFDDDDIGYDDDTLNQIKDEYYTAYERYMFIRDEIELISDNELDEEEVEETDDLESPVNNLYYLTNSDEPDKCYLINDLEHDFRLESYERVKDLIKEFKRNDRSHFESYRYNKGFYKIKDDQIRIMLKSLKNNNYLVLGAFIKKATSDKFDYKKQIKRYTDRKKKGQDLKIEELHNLEYSQKVEEVLLDMAETLGRTNQRA